MPRFRRRVSPGAHNFRWHGHARRYSYNEAPPNGAGDVVLLDERLAEVARVGTVAGLAPAMMHEFLITDEGNYLFVVNEPAVRDLSRYPAPDPDADRPAPSSAEPTRDSVIQEVTPDGREVFRWNAWEHLKLSDCRWRLFPREYAKLNSLDLSGGDLIASFRACSVVLKIERPSGRVLWQLGGSDPAAPDPFDTSRPTFDRPWYRPAGDPRGGFCAQHTALETAPGRILLFDNGQCPDGDRSSSRVVEYQLGPGGAVAAESPAPGRGALERHPGANGAVAAESPALGRGAPERRPGAVGAGGEAAFVRHHEPGRLAVYGGAVAPLPNGNWLIAWGAGPGRRRHPERGGPVRRRGARAPDLQERAPGDDLPGPAPRRRATAPAPAADGDSDDGARRRTGIPARQAGKRSVGDMSGISLFRRRPPRDHPPARGSRSICPPSADDKDTIHAVRGWRGVSVSSPLPPGEGPGVRAEVEESPRRWADTRPSLTPNPSPSGRGALHPAGVNWPWARGGSPRRAAGAAGGRPGLRKALGYAVAALALLLGAPAALAQTATLAASSVEDDTATLTLTNHTGDWYYKYTVPSGDTSCTLVSSGTYTASLTSLTPATSYTYKAYSNSSCSTELTSASTDAEFLTKPGQVTGVGATAANTSLAVSWTALTGTVTGYKVQWKKGDESYTSGRTNTVTGGSSTTNSITGLTNGTRYTVRVTAYNATGDGDASSEVTGTPTAGFGFNDTVDDQTWAEGTAVNVTLPAANAACYLDQHHYSLSPALPAGLSFNSARDSRVISGTPTAPKAQTQYTYRAGNYACYQTASQTFNITVKGAIELSAASVALTEGGGNQTYNVKLGAQPNANATISITTGDAGAVTVSPSSLTFTTTNWGTNQAVTLTPVNDADGADEAVTITHTAAGGGIGGKTASLTANVTDDDKGITLSRTSYTIREGNSWVNSHTVVLDAAPAGNVTVLDTNTINLAPIIQRDPRSLTFTTSNWNLPQQIEMRVAISNTRTRNVTGSLFHTASGGGYGGASATLTVVYIDNQTPGLTISPGTLSVAEGSTGTFTVKLGGAPNGNVTVAVTSGDSGAATVSPSSLTFTTTTANWNTNRTVTVTAVQDADGNNETVALTSTAAGGGFDAVSGTVTLTVTDDEKALLASNVTHDSATLTITNHTGDWYYKKTVPSGDTTCTLVSSGTYTASLSGLTPATSYTFKAYSNSACSTEITSNSTDADFLTRPAKVTGVTAAGAADAGALDVGWTAVTGAASYKVQWKTSAQQWAASRQTTSTTTSKTLSSLTGGTQYSVRVAASNTTGDGPWSDTATGTAATEGATPSTTSLAVPEGGSASYTVVLDTTPSHAVTIAVAKQSGGDSDLTVSPASLSFSTTNWNSPQAVTVTAKQDSDTTAGTATLTHTATSSDSGYSGITIANVTATEGDDDAPGALVSKTAVPVPEGGSATWTVRLASLPSATVFIDLAKQSGGDADLTVSPAQLTFTTKGWDLPQTVTVSAAEDTDAARGAATFTHTATSTDASYGASLAIASVTATEDDDELGVTVSKKAVSVPEGGSATWTVVLDGPPTANVTIAVAKQSGGDGNLTVSPSSLTFTSSNWSSTQTVTVSAAQDGDETDGTATFTHTATSTDTDFNGLAIASVAATEDDDDAPGVTVSKASVSVTEGSTATWTVVLDTAPSANVTIAVAKQSGGDADLTVSPASLTFTSTNWSSVQTVTVSAAEDDTDDTDGSATITHTATSTDADYGGIAIASVTATEADNDTLAGVTLSKTSLTVAEGGSATYTVALDTAPSANVTIAVANRGQSADDSDLTVSPSSLTFTSTNYSSAQTVTVSAAQDADDADGAAVLTHTATSTDASYGGIAIANVTATEDDDETPGAAPTSADVTLAVSRDNRTAIPLSSLPFSDEDSADTLRGVRIVTLPAASDGTLGLVKTGIYTGASTVLCVGTITPITAGQEVLDAVSTVLYFCPKDGFNRTTFRFRVIDSQGRASEKTHTATLAGPPGQVTGLVAEAGSTYVRLSWTDPKNPAITGYEYRQRSGAGVTTWGAWKAMTGSGATTTSHSVSGLTNATAYTFQVRAKSAGGAGPIPSAAVTATPASGVVPAKTAGLQVVNLGFNTANTYVKVRLVWDDPNDPSITRYEAVRQLKSTSAWVKPIDWTNTHVPSSGATTTTTEFDAGSHEATYAFRVRAVNAAGNGPWSDTVSLELDSDGETPVLESVEPGNGKLRLRWTHSGSSLKNYGGYWGYRRGHAGTVTNTDLSSTQAGAAARSYVAGSLTNGSTYTWAVYSWGKRDADDPSARLPLYSNTRTLTLPAAPAKPAGLTAKATPGGAALAWTDPKNGAITGWQYQHKAGAGSYGSWTRVPGSTAGTTSVSVSKLANGTEHKFKVRAVIEYETALGGALAGAASDEASVTPVGVVVSKDRLALTEGGAAGAYTVKLSQAPTANVTITVSVDGDGSVTADTDDVAAGNQSTLTFTSTNYATARTVKVKAAEDDDGRDSTATIAHAASSTDARYGNLVGLPGLTAAVTDNDALGMTLSKSSVSVTEGSTATYTVRLDVKPSSAVTVTIVRASGGDSDLTIADTDPGTTGTQNTLAFSTANYATARTVTVRAAEDDNDVIDGTATFTHTAAGGGYGNVAAVTLAATETDDDTGIVLTPASLSVPEEGSATYTVALGTRAGRRGDGGDRAGERRRLGPDGEPELADVQHHQLRHRADGHGVGGRRRRRSQRHGDVHAHRGGRGQRLRRGDRVARGDGGRQRAPHRSVGVERVADRGRLDGKLHRGALVGAGRQRDGRGFERRRGGGDGEPVVAHLLDDELFDGADGDPDRGERRGRGRRVGDGDQRRHGRGLRRERGRRGVGGRRRPGVDPVVVDGVGERRRHDGELHGEARRGAARQRDGGGFERRHRCGDGEPVVADLHHHELRLGADGDPDSW